MASLSNINGLFDVHSTGAILFSNTHGTSGQILRSNGNAAPTWVDFNSTGFGGDYLLLTGGVLTGNLTINGTNNLTVGGTVGITGLLTGTTGSFSGLVSGITPTAAANFATKGYVDGLTPGTGVFLPLAGGALTGATSITVGTNTTTFSTTANQLIIKNSYNTAASGLALKSSNNTHCMQLYGESAQYGFLASEWGAWNIRKVVSGGLYLNNNTTYFVQPEGTSNMNAATYTGDFSVSGVTTLNNLDVTDTIAWRVSSTDAARQRADARDDATTFSRLHWFGKSSTAGTSNFRHAYYDGANYINVTAVSGAVNFEGILGATGGNSTQWNLAYNNQGNYLPLAGGTLTGALVATTIRSDDLFAKGMIRATGWYNTNTGNGTGYGVEIGQSGGQGYVLSYSRDASAYQALNITGSYTKINNSVRSPIYYDSDDTGYFLNPSAAGGNSLKTIGDWRQNTDGWSGEVGGKMQYHGSNWYIQAANSFIYRNSAGANQFYVDNTGTGVITNYLTGTNSLRAPIFYDSNDTSYYLDPATNISAILAGSVGINNTSPINTAWGSATTTKQLSITGANYGVINLQGSATALTKYSMGVGGNTFYMAYDNIASRHNITINNSGQVVIAVDIRAPIFYDSNDTSYYLDPNGGSVLNYVNHEIGIGVNKAGSQTSTNGISLYGTYTGGVPTYGMMFTGTSGQGTHGSVTDGWATFFTMNDNNARGWIFRKVGGSNTSSISAGGVATFDSSIRSPIFYDSNNTGYYLDPQATSAINTVNIKGAITFPSSNLGAVTRGSENFAIYQESGSWTTPYPDLNIGFHTGISMGAYSGYNGMRFYNDANMVTQVMSINNVSDGLGADDVYVNNSLVAGSSLRAPIFYDSNNTAYYGDFASESRMASIRIGGSGYSLLSADNSQNTKFQGNSGSSCGITGFASTGTHLFQIYGSGINYGFLNGNWAGWDIKKTKGGPLYLNGSSVNYLNGTEVVYSIYYDSDNTAYYVDPASTSRLLNLDFGVAGYYLKAGSWGVRNQTPYGYIEFGPANSSYGHIYTDRPNFYMNAGLYINGGSWMRTGDIRSAIFYDVNNTAFYLDASSTGTSLNVAGDVVGYSSSDIRYKDNVKPIENALDKIDKIKGYTFEWNELSHKQTGKKDIGVIAQEVEEILPEIIDTRSDGYKAVDYPKLTALLIQSVKEQQIIINDLKSRIEKLEL